ncbi:hypothetical protein [Wenjunlia tyrosinilytica]|uniref:Uncharacterized protein n=1 Tax=Wenjunlia tyrosinilytica TaxID=1544741 RepID=A0A917ZVI4_9ACTN|nr:hypothetical protein [Wenjunlia tyrosinilytica]GGO95889.1 hypothetical protein GCM10012280_54130 [Wenjunlia tyrosinilytica]
MDANSDNSDARLTGERVAEDLQLALAAQGFWIQARGMEPIDGRAYVSVDPIRADVAVRLIDRIRGVGGMRRTHTMDLRVYSVNRMGIVTRQGTQIRVRASDPVPLLDSLTKWPPCECERATGRPCPERNRDVGGVRAGGTGSDR